MDTEKRLQELEIGELVESMFPSEPPPAEAYLRRHTWSLSEFCALAYRLHPEKIVDMHQRDLTNTEKQRIKGSQALYKKLSKYAKEITMHEAIPLDGTEFHMRPLKYMKWCALKRIFLPKIDGRSFPGSFWEQYLEFLDYHSLPRMYATNSNVYHKALYLKHAEQVRQKFPSYSNLEICQEKHMQNVLKYIKRRGSKATQETITRYWLPELKKRKRGRPKKRG